MKDDKGPDSDATTGKRGSGSTNDTKPTGVRIWTGKLRLNGERKKEGDAVYARIILTGPTVVFHVCENGEWRAGDPNEIHAASWLRALGATGSEVG